jgi:hypothetical protein
MSAVRGAAAETSGCSLRCDHRSAFFETSRRPVREVIEPEAGDLPSRLRLMTTFARPSAYPSLVVGAGEDSSVLVATQDAPATWLRTEETPAG